MIKIKTIIATITGLIGVSFFGTLLAFAYRYMWFATETMPADRVIVASFIGIIFLFISVGVASGIK